jgi:hypothetical protein
MEVVERGPTCNCYSVMVPLKLSRSLAQLPITLSTKHNSSVCAGAGDSSSTCAGGADDLTSVLSQCFAVLFRC